MSRRQALLVHATNITGLGASQVLRSILASLQKEEIGRDVDCYLPAVGPSAGIVSSQGDFRVHALQRRLPNSVSRMFECVASRAYFGRYEYGITLGDIPLRNVRHQVVLTHQSHLTPPHINPYSDRSVNGRMMRWLYRRNLPRAKHFVVQTEIMRHDLIAAYPELEGRITVVPQPPPIWFKPGASSPTVNPSRPLELFYPAAGYDHKNHRLLGRMAAEGRPPEGFRRLVLTLQPEEASVVDVDVPWLHNVGRLSPDDCLDRYRQVDGLFFPSTAESYGLPLVEAMALGIPVVCSDLPFARWLCEDQGIYFDPQDPQGAWRAIEVLIERRRQGWRPDWSGPLSKLPESWDDVAGAFLRLLNLP